MIYELLVLEIVS